MRNQTRKSSAKTGARGLRKPSKFVRSDTPLEKRRAKPLRAALDRPVTDVEPRFLHDVPMDSVASALALLASEVSILRERVIALEDLIARAGLTAPDAVERHRLSKASAERTEAAVKQLAERFWGELSRSDTPVSRIKPEALDYWRGKK